MKSLLISLFIVLPSCSWIAYHPKEDALILEAVEKAAQEFYEYETHSLSPAPPPGYPPMMMPGPKGVELY